MTGSDLIATAAEEDAVVSTCTTQLPDGSLATNLPLPLVPVASTGCFAASTTNAAAIYIEPALFRRMFVD
jgi:hypothetical protein